MERLEETSFGLLVSRSILPEPQTKSLEEKSCAEATKSPLVSSSGLVTKNLNQSYEPFEQTPNDSPWKLNHPFTEVLVGAPK